ncbi:hypothetical protein [Gymnodinialimonas sp.]
MGSVRFIALSALKPPRRDLARSRWSSSIELPVATQGGCTQQAQTGEKLLFIGFSKVETMELSRLYEHSQTQAHFMRGCSQETKSAHGSRFEAVAIHVDNCEQYGPSIVDQLRTAGAIEYDHDVVAVTGYPFKNFTDHLQASGFTRILSSSGGLEAIFPNRVKVS